MKNKHPNFIGCLSLYYSCKLVIFALNLLCIFYYAKLL
nr:MAG TPA: hypothetical protein [Caudoviricetes sp.]